MQRRAAPNKWIQSLGASRSPGDSIAENGSKDDGEKDKDGNPLDPKKRLEKEIDSLVAANKGGADDWDLDRVGIVSLALIPFLSVLLKERGQMLYMSNLEETQHIPLVLLVPVLYGLVLAVFLTAWCEYPRVLDVFPVPLGCLLLFLLLRSFLPPLVHVALSLALHAAVLAAAYFSCGHLFQGLVLGPNVENMNLTLNVNKAVYVVTGGNAGIGYSTVVDLLSRGAKVLMLCRSKDKGEKAKTAILTEAGVHASEIEVFECDLESVASVRSCAKAIDSKYGTLSCLILNAGCFQNVRKVTADGHECTVQSNHLGHFLLVHLLAPLLRPTSRVVVVGSSTHRMSDRTGVFVDDLTCEKRPYTQFGQYSQSKLMNLLFVVELARRSKEAKKGFTAYCVHPGLVRTNVHANLGKRIVQLHKIFGVVMGALMKPQAYGASTTLYCALEERAALKSGGYYSGCEWRECSRWAKDEKMAKELWEASEKALKIKTSI